MRDNYLAKWLSDELTPEELAEFKKTDEYAACQRILKVSDTLKGPDFDVDIAHDKFRNSQSKNEVPVVSLRPLQKILRVAAAIAAIIAVSYFYVISLDESVSTQYAERTEISLPDASEVILNAESEISYSERKWDIQRSVSLEGEAFFKVAKGKKFTVDTDHGLVSVLGTQFNVENRKGFFEVTCFEGLVSVSYNGKQTKLPAGTSFLVIDGSIRNTEALESTSPSWLRDESSFKSIPLAYVLDEFQRQFNIEVETRNIDLGQLFTGTFSNTNLDLALQSISTPSQIKYTLGEHNVLFYANETP